MTKRPVYVAQTSLTTFSGELTVGVTPKWKVDIEVLIEGSDARAVDSSMYSPEQAICLAALIPTNTPRSVAEVKDEIKRFGAMPRSVVKANPLFGLKDDNMKRVARRQMTELVNGRYEHPLYGNLFRLGKVPIESMVLIASVDNMQYGLDVIEKYFKDRRLDDSIENDLGHLEHDFVGTFITGYKKRDPTPRVVFRRGQNIDPNYPPRRRSGPRDIILPKIPSQREFTDSKSRRDYR